MHPNAHCDIGPISLTFRVRTTVTSHRPESLGTDLLSPLSFPFAPAQIKFVPVCPGTDQVRPGSTHFSLGISILHWVVPALRVSLTLSPWRA